MYNSLTNTLMRLDDATVLYPGHNYARTPTSTIGAERQHNPYVQFTSLHAFLRAMGY
jgi:glyoxylase-like metal-dependent hydrolase (beta-lactamase superfamily II)